MPLFCSQKKILNKFQKEHTTNNKLQKLPLKMCLWLRKTKKCQQSSGKCGTQEIAEHFYVSKYLLTLIFHICHMVTEDNILCHSLCFHENTLSGCLLFQLSFDESNSQS